MQKRIIPFIFLFALSFPLLGIVAYKTIVGVNTSSSTATIYVDPQTSTGTVGQNFTINISISDVTDLYGWEFKLRWNSTLLDAKNVLEGPFLKQGGNTFFTFKINNTEGYMIVDCTLLGNVPGVSGNGILATVKFYVEAQGECVLDLYDTKLVNSSEQSITHTTIDGNFRTIVRDVAITSVTTSKTVVVVGEIVDITVVAKNEGTETETFNVTAQYDNVSIETQAVNNLAADANTTLTFSWNTTGVSAGNYTIKAIADIVSGETDTADNTLIDGTILLTTPIHDIAIINVTSSKTSVTPGEIVYIYVTVENQGDFTETFTVNASYTLRVDPVIGTETVTLASGASTTITFTWDTTGLSGYCTISAIASVVSGEIDIADNTYTDGTVCIGSQGGLSGGSRHLLF